MTGNTIQLYDDFFIKEYTYLLGFAKSINVREDYESLLHDCYIKCKVKISGFTGTTSGFLNFTRVVIMNTFKTKYRDKKHTTCIEEVQDDVEQILIEEHEYQEERKNYDNEMSFLNTMAYEYVNQYFNEKENMVFKTYYVLKHKHLNYKQLSIATDLSITTVSNIIKRIKKDLKLNLMCYINTGMKTMELQEKLNRIETVLKIDIWKCLQCYQEVYKIINGRTWSGCPCHREQLKESLKAWYNKNKTNLN